MSYHNCPTPEKPTGDDPYWQCPLMICRKWYKWNHKVNKWFLRREMSK